MAQALQREPKAHVRHKIIHVIAQLARALYDLQSPWNELVPACMSMLQSPDANLRESALSVLDRVSEYCKEVRPGPHPAASAFRPPAHLPAAAPARSSSFLTRHAWPRCTQPC